MNDNSGRIIGITGTQGAGKSSLALNLALAWAGLQGRAALVVEFPSLKRRRGAGAVDPAAMLRLWPAIVGRPQIAVSPYGVGVLRMGRTVRSRTGPPDAAVSSALARLSETYDLFLDIDERSPHRELALSHCRLAFWVGLPRRSHLGRVEWTSEGALAGLGKDRVEAVVNRAWERGARSIEDIARSLTLLGWRQPIPLPYDASVPRWDSAGRLLIEERPWSPWIGALRRPLSRVADVLGASAAA
ncbi:MAG: hypothetical protein HY078_09750 [Elusimicrobia bacterium]|nr:hypothetical protein [Elusimicrobiota bacterium]